MTELPKEIIEANATNKVPAWVDPKKVKEVVDPITGKKVKQLTQKLPSHLAVNARKLYANNGIGRPVLRREAQAVRRNTSVLAQRTQVKEGEKLELPAADGSILFYHVVKSGWFSARFADVKIRGKVFRRIVIDSGHGAAVLQPDPAMTHDWRLKDD
jgi:hypothetical protein